MKVWYKGVFISRTCFPDDNPRYRLTLEPELNQQQLTGIVPVGDYDKMIGVLILQKM